MSSRSSSKSFTPRSFPGYYCVGWVKSAHGIRGEIYVQLSAGRADWLKSLKTLAWNPPNKSELEIREIEAARPHKEGLILKLQGIDNRNQSEELRKSSVYIDESLLESAPGDQDFYLKEILGFMVLDQGREVGPIEGFATNGAQDLLRVRCEEREVLIPFVEDFLVRIDFPGRRVEMHLPDGLFDL